MFRILQVPVNTQLPSRPNSPEPIFRVGAKPAMRTCPRCEYERPGGAVECPRCGVVFGKLERDADVPSRSIGVIVSQEAGAEAAVDGKLGWKELSILATGLAAALVVQAVGPLRFVMSALVTLFHELGHAVASWLVGHPAVPAFDFVYGGGFTHVDNFKLPLVLFIGGAWVWLGWLLRRNPRALLVIGIVSALWLFCVSAAWRRELVIAAMGHGGEFILAGVFLYMALANVGWRAPEVERPLGAFVAFFVQIHSMHFAWKLGHDAAFLDFYLQGKGGALLNDLETISLDLRIHTPIGIGVEGVADWLLLLSPLPFAVALLLHLYRSRVERLAASLLVTEPGGAPGR